LPGERSDRGRLSARRSPLVELAARAEEIAEAVDVSGVNTFQAQRRLIRVALDDAGIAGEIDALVLALTAPLAAESTTAS